MLAFVLRRLLQSIGVMLTVAFIAFALFNFVGDPINNMVGQDAGLKDREALRHQLGLDDPFVLQFARFVGRAAQGDFGISYQYARPVSQLIAERLPATLELSFCAAGLALLLGIPAGIYTGLHRRSWLAQAILAFSLAGISLPTFLIGILLILVFSVNLPWLPSFGRGTTVALGWWTTGFLTSDGLRALILPSVTLGLFQMTLIMRLVRAEMLEVLRADYIKFARARGLPDRVVHFGHALKNTLVPVITVTGLQLGSIIAFAIITETVFQWPGMGLLIIQAIGFADIPVMSAYLVLVAFFFVVINLVVDLLYFAVDPRLRIERTGRTSMAEKLLEVRDLKVGFATRRGPVIALDGVSFDIAAGEVLGVVGESGAGKSLTGSAVIGLLEPPAFRAGGEIRLAGKRIDDLPPRAMRRLRGKEIGAIFQDPLTSLNPLYTVGRQLVETIRYHLGLDAAAARRRAAELLQEVGIPGGAARLDAWPHEFSGGMRQRVVIALALAANPRLIIADEPTTALDVSIQAQIVALLRRLCREHGTAIMLVTHDMGVIAETADRVAVMYAGRIAEIGPVREVIERPSHPYTAGLMGAIPAIGGPRDRLQQIDGAMPRPGAIPAGCPFHPRCPEVFARCHVERPSLIPAGEGAAACWLPTRMPRVYRPAEQRGPAKGGGRG